MFAATLAILTVAHGRPRGVCARPVVSVVVTRNAILLLLLHAVSFPTIHESRTLLTKFVLDVRVYAHVYILGSVRSISNENVII